MSVTPSVLFRLPQAWIVVALLVLAAVPAGAQVPNPTAIQEVLVRLQPTLTPEEVEETIAALATKTGTSDLGRLTYRPIYRLDLEGKQPDTPLATLRADPRVAYAESNAILRAAGAPSDPAVYTCQWGFRRIGGPAAVATAALHGLSSDTILAIVDTGIDERHRDLAGRFVPGKDFVAGDDDPRDENGHGTHTAAIAAATTGNHLGIAAPFPGKLMAMRALDWAGCGSVSEVVEGIDWAVAHGARVINLGLVGEDSITLRDAVHDAAAADVVLVAAAGNSGDRSTYYPAAYSEVISVSGWGYSNTNLAPSSSYDSTVELTAPGEYIYSAFLQGGYQIYTGTSTASALVAGAAAALIAVDPTLSAECVRHLLQATAEDLLTSARDERTGYGMVRLDLALAALLDGNLPADCP